MRVLSAVFKERGGAAPIWEISFVVACVLISEWVVPIFFGKSFIPGAVPACIAFLFIVVSQIARGDSARDIGFRIDNFPQAIATLLPPMLFASFVLIAIGWSFGSLRFGDVRFDTRLISIAVGLFIWSLIQEYPLQGFINRRSQAILGAGNRSVFFVAAIFALLHLPNLSLMAATFFGGLLWSFVYQRAPNLWALALSHAVMTAVLVMTVPEAALHGLRVGYNYYR